MTDRQRRVLESIENLITHPNTPDNEKKAAIGRWETITGEKWSGNPKTRSSASSASSGAHNNSGANNNRDAWWEDIFRNAYTHGSYEDTFKNRKQQQQQNKNNWNYDFGGGCTQKQYEYIKSISNFFRWKCPQRHEIEFDEAKEFLNEYAELFQMFLSRTRNFTNLKKLFEALGIDWSQTKRTFKWKIYGEK